MERPVTVDFGPSRSKRLGRALAEARSGAGECSEVEPGRYRTRFVLGTDSAVYAGLARLLERVRHWWATEVCEDDVAVELKCGEGRDALAACAWDALKLTFALQMGEVSAGYLVAATPAADWALGFRGSELFEAGLVETADLRDRFRDWWQKWERDGYPAGRTVPARFGTRAVDRVAFDVDASA